MIINKAQVYNGKITRTKNEILQSGANKQYNYGNYYRRDLLVSTGPGKVPANTASYGRNRTRAFANITNTQAGGDQLME